MSNNVIDSINLLTYKKNVSDIVRKLNRILPVVAVLSIVITLVIYLTFLVYTNNNISRYSSVSAEVNRLENSIKNKKNIEGTYFYTISLVKTIINLNSLKKNYLNLMDKLSSYSIEGSVINAVSIDQQNNVSFNIISSSSVDLVNFISMLLSDVYDTESAKISNIVTSPIIRNELGTYTFSLSFKADASLIQ